MLTTDNKKKPSKHYLTLLSVHVHGQKTIHLFTRQPAKDVIDSGILLYLTLFKPHLGPRENLVKTGMLLLHCS